MNVQSYLNTSVTRPKPSAGATKPSATKPSAGATKPSATKPSAGATKPSADMTKQTEKWLAAHGVKPTRVVYATPAPKDPAPGAAPSAASTVGQIAVAAAETPRAEQIIPGAAAIAARDAAMRARVADVPLQQPGESARVQAEEAIERPVNGVKLDEALAPCDGAACKAMAWARENWRTLAVIALGVYLVTRK